MIIHEINDKTRDECWKLEHNPAWQRREGEAGIMHGKELGSGVMHV